MHTVLNQLATLVKQYETTSNRSAELSIQIDELIKEWLPHGSGIDAGVNLDLENSTADKIVLTFGYHHMNEAGYYSGWSAWTLTLTASLANGFDMTLIGEDDGSLDLTRIDEETGEEYSDNEFAIETTGEYLHETFEYALNQTYIYPSQLAADNEAKRLNELKRQTIGDALNYDVPLMLKASELMDIRNMLLDYRQDHYLSDHALAIEAERIHDLIKAATDKRIADHQALFGS